MCVRIQQVVGGSVMKMGMDMERFGACIYNCDKKCCYGVCCVYHLDPLGWELPTLTPTLPLKLSLMTPSLAGL